MPASSTPANEGAARPESPAICAPGERLDSVPDVFFVGSLTAAVEKSVVGSCCLGRSLGNLGVLDRRLGDVEGHVGLGPGAAELLE